MKFKVGDLVQVDQNTMSFEKVDGDWQHVRGPILGVVVGGWKTNAYKDSAGEEPHYMYEVMIRGKLEQKIESALTRAK